MAIIRESFSKANFFFRDGNYDKARDLYEEIIKTNPYLTKVWNNLGLSYLKLKNFEKAIEVMKEGLKLDSEDDSLSRNLGVAYFYAEEYQNSIEVLQKCLKNSPHNETLLCNIGISYSHLGNHKKAIKTYKLVLDLDDRYVSAWKNLCLTYTRMGVDFKYDDLKPNSEIAWFFLSKALLTSGLFDEALDACNKALRKNPGFHAAYIIKNKTKAMLREKEISTSRTVTMAQQKSFIESERVEEDSYYARFKRIQEKMHQRTIKEELKRGPLSLEERFRLVQEKFKKRKLEFQGLIKIEEGNLKTKREQSKEFLDDQRKGEVISLVPNEQEKILGQNSLSRPKSDIKLICIGNKYFKIEECSFIIDGANIACEGVDSGDNSGKLYNLILLKKKLKSYGIKNYLIICDRSLFYKIDDTEAYKKMINDKEIIETPGGTEADNYILQLAKKDDAYIISNDMFREFYKYFGKAWIKSKRITFKIIRQSLFLDKIFTAS